MKYRIRMIIPSYIVEADTMLEARNKALIEFHKMIQEGDFYSTVTYLRDVNDLRDEELERMI